MGSVVKCSCIILFILGYLTIFTENDKLDSVKLEFIYLFNNALNINIYIYIYIYIYTLMNNNDYRITDFKSGF
jgi:hypothetical protein